MREFHCDYYELPTFLRVGSLYTSFIYMYCFLRNVAAVLRRGRTASYISSWVSHKAQRAVSVSQPRLSMIQGWDKQMQLSEGNLTPLVGRSWAKDLEPGLQSLLTKNTAHSKCFHA